MQSLVMKKLGAVFGAVVAVSAAIVHDPAAAAAVGPAVAHVLDAVVTLGGTISPLAGALMGAVGTLLAPSLLHKTGSH